MILVNVNSSIVQLLKKMFRSFQVIPFTMNTKSGIFSLKIIQQSRFFFSPYSAKLVLTICHSNKEFCKTHIFFFCFQGDGEGSHELRKFFLADPNIFPPKLDYQSS